MIFGVMNEISHVRNGAPSSRRVLFATRIAVHELVPAASVLPSCDRVTLDLGDRLLLAVLILLHDCVETLRHRAHLKTALSREGDGLLDKHVLEAGGRGPRTKGVRPRFPTRPKLARRPLKE